MSSPATPIATYRGTSSGSEQRGWNLALAFQEVLTAVVRVRFGRQAVASADVFRTHVKDSLRAAAQDAMTRGYSQEDVQLAVYAVVAFIDESVMNSPQPVFAEWPRQPLQEELFGGHVAGETFFENLQKVMARNTQSADLLEIFALCLLLGYKGRYAVASGDLAGITHALRDKIQRIRGATGLLGPRGMIPAESIRLAQSDPWIRRLALGAAACALLALLCFVMFKLLLVSGASDLHAIAGRIGGS